MDCDTRTPREAEAAEHYARTLRPVFAGRRLLLIGGPVAGLAKWAAGFRALGAESCFLLADGLGTGILPDPVETPWTVLGTTGEDIVDAMRNGERALARMPEGVRRELDRWDPEGGALVVGGILLTDVETVAGRRRFARRPPEWIALEDKVVVDEFFDGAGIPRPPSAVVAADGDALRRAARRLDRGLGTAWAGDAREGPNGGAVYLRRVRTEEDAAEAAAWFAARCDRVRVTPFLEGIPCSVQGVVLPGGTAVFRPMEMVTLRPAAGNRLLYAGAATFWDPPPADREAMRAATRRAGEALRARLGYRGGFTVDGVLTEEGFLPTELNPRLGAGHVQLASAIPGLPLAPLALAAVEGSIPDDRPEFLEEVLTAAADRNRSGGAWITVPGHREATESRSLVEEEGGGWRPAADGEAPGGTLSVGPSSAGMFVRFLPAAGAIPPGPPFAPRAVRVFEAADRHGGTAVGPLEAAREVRPGAP